MCQEILLFMFKQVHERKEGGYGLPSEASEVLSIAVQELFANQAWYSQRSCCCACRNTLTRRAPGTKTIIILVTHMPPAKYAAQPNRGILVTKNGSVGLMPGITYVPMQKEAAGVFCSSTQKVLHTRKHRHTKGVCWGASPFLSNGNWRKDRV